MNIGRDIRNDCYEKLQRQSLSYFNVTPVGYLISRVMNDTGNIGTLFSWRLSNTVWSVFYLIFCIGSMFYLNAGLAVVVVVLFSLSAFIITIFDRRILERNREVRRSNATLTASLNENITGAKTIKALAIEEDICREFDGKNVSLRKKSISAKLLSSVFAPIIIVLGNIVLAVILSAGKVFSGSAALIGSLAVFITYSITMIDIVQGVAGFFIDAMGTQVNAERVNRLIEAPVAVVDRPDVIAKYGDAFTPKTENWEPIVGNIDFEDVSFRYPDGNVDVLSHFNLKVKAGSMVAIVGETGAGKSTLVNLACRFFEPTAGRVLIDGVDYRERSLGWLHSSIGYVLQQPHLFSGTILDNIRYSNPDITKEEACEAAKIAAAHEFISALPQGYDTLVGEGGDMLSTGQKQLISIAMAVAAKPAIFILDEATSSVDTQTEQLITQVMERVLAGRTSFVIAHRLSTIKKADVILMVMNGEIVEKGTHKELLHARGHYYNLYSMQYENEEFDKAFSEEGQ